MPCDHATYIFGRVAVSHVVFEQCKGLILRIIARKQVCSCSPQFWLKPEPRVLRTSGNIPDKRIRGVCDPESRGLAVCFVAIGALVRNDPFGDTCLRTQVTNELISCLYAIFGKVAVTLGVKGNVFLNKELVRPVHDDTPLVRLADSIFGDDRSGHVLAKVKVNRVLAECSLLTKVVDFNPLYGLHDGRSVHDHEVTTVARSAVVASLEQNVSREKGHFDGKILVLYHRRWTNDGRIQVQCNIPCHRRVGHLRDGSHLSFIPCASVRSDENFGTWGPFSFDRAVHDDGVGVVVASTSHIVQSGPGRSIGRKAVDCLSGRRDKFVLEDAALETT
jgi:hypothetical protein